MEENLEWDEITWGNTYMKAKEVTIENLVSFKYYKKSKWYYLKLKYILFSIYYQMKLSSGVLSDGPAIISILQ